MVSFVSDHCNTSLRSRLPCMENLEIDYILKIIVICLAVAVNEAHVCDCWRNMGHFAFAVEMAKRFVNVNLHCAVINWKRLSKMLRLLLPGNNSANAQGRFRNQLIHSGEKWLWLGIFFGGSKMVVAHCCT